MLVRFSLALVALLPLTAAFNQAMACACCSERGERHVMTGELADYQWAEIDRLRFGPSADLYTGEGDAKEIEGIANPDSSYALTAVREGKKITFTFKGADRGAGTLSMTLPDKIAFFEVDPRDATPETPEPSLYKEWKFTAEPTGTGDFAAGAGKGQHLTLILQGRGNNCVSAEDFGHWSMVMEGPKGNYLLFGDMGTPQ